MTQDQTTLREMSRIIVLRDPGDLTAEVQSCIRSQNLTELVIDYSLTSDGDVVTNSPLANISDAEEFRFKITIGEHCQSLEKLFFNCASLKSAPPLDLSRVKNLSWMFEDCRSLTQVPGYCINAAEKLRGMFRNCSSLSLFPNLETSRRIPELDCLGITQGCTSLTDVPEFKSPIIILNSPDDVTDIVRLRTASLDLDEIVINFNVERKLLFGQFTQSNSPFSGIPTLKKIPFKITIGPSCRSLNGLFFGCANLQEGPELDTSRVTNFDSMFQDCTGLTRIPCYDTGAGISMRNMFHGCNSLEKLPLLNTSSATNLFGMLEGCCSLEELPPLNLESVQDLSWFLSGCTRLIRLPRLNTRNAEYMCSMFNHCTSLCNIPGFSLRKVKDMEKIFSGYTNENAINRFFGIFGWRRWSYRIRQMLRRRKKSPLPLR